MKKQAIHSQDLNQSVRASSSYRVTVDGMPVTVHQCDVASYAIITMEGPAVIEVEALYDFEAVQVRPIRAGIRHERLGNRLLFEIASPCKLSLELDGDLRNPLFLFLYEGQAAYSAQGSGLHYFEAGQIHEAGEIRLKSGDTVILEEGAIVRGRITAEGAEDIAIIGRGILDGSNWRNGSVLPYEERTQMIKLVGCKRVLIEGITVVDGANWHVVPIACRDVLIRGINIITFEGTGDGIDVVGSEHVAIEDCFIRSNDDCVAVKAVDYMDPAGLKDVAHVRIERCVLWNANWGNCLEIGYETRCQSIHDIAFTDCDIIHCEFEGHQSGGTFTIHHGDRARISSIRYENIWVEDAQEKLFDIKILHSKYSRDAERGYIDGVSFTNIHVIDGPLPVSIIRGWNEDHMVENITFRHIYFHGERIKSANEARMVVELARGIQFL